VRDILKPKGGVFMSIVIGLLSDYGCYILSDRRATDAISRKVKSEHVTKAFRLSEHALVGFTGDYAMARNLIQNYQSVVTNAGHLYVEEAFKALLILVREIDKITPEPLFTQFVVVGKTKQHRQMMYTFQRNTGVTQTEHIPHAIPFKILCPESSFDLTSRFQTLMIASISQTHRPIDNRIKGAFAALLHEYANHEPSINENITMLKIF
jgi:hypothetical protein